MRITVRQTISSGVVLCLLLGSAVTAMSAATIRVLVRSRAQGTNGFQFSKSEVPIPKPVTVNSNLPPGLEDAANKEFYSFQPAAPFLPSASRPMVPPPERSSRTEKSEKKTVFDEPRIFSDPAKATAEKGEDGENEDENAPGQRAEKRGENQRDFQNSSADSKGRDEEHRSLSLIQRFNWRPSKKEKHESSGASSYLSLQSRDKEEEDSESAFSNLEKERDAEDSAPPEISFFRFFDGPPKKDTDRAQENRLDLDRLLTPNAKEQRPAGSLDPITSLIAPPKALPMLPQASMPAVSTPMPNRGVAFTPGPVFGGPQQSLWRGPTLDNVSTRFSVVNGLKPVSGPTPPARAPAPLMNQPTALEFPGRKF